MLNKDQYLFLKYIYNTKSIGEICTEFQFKDYQDINNIIDNPLNYFQYGDLKYDNDTIVSLTNLGKALVDTHYDISKKFWIPTPHSLLRC